MRKRLLSLALAAFLAVSLMPQSVLAEGTESREAEAADEDLDEAEEAQEAELFDEPVMLYEAEKLAVPELLYASAAESWITVEWNAVEGAAGYAIYRKSGTSDWKMIDTLEDTIYVDSSAQAGIEYRYTVRAYMGTMEEALGNKYDSAYWSGFDRSGVSAFIAAPLNTPQMISAANVLGGIKIQWADTPGAEGYAIYRKSGNAGWKMIDTLKGISYTDTSVSSNVKYAYTVRAYQGGENSALANKYSSAYWSGFDRSGKSCLYLKAPELKDAANSSDGIKVSWESVSGAKDYQLYRKTGSGAWQTIAYVKGTSYTDKSGLKSGTKYTYTVRARKGSDRSHHTSGISVTKGGAVQTPELSSASNVLGGVQVKWKAVSGAKGYAVYRKSANAGWKMIGTASGTSYTDKTPSANVTYSYTVRAFAKGKEQALANKYSSAYWSGFDSKGVSCLYLTSPAMKGAENVSGGIKVSWNAVKGAADYQLYRKSGNGAWQTIAYVEGTSYTDKDSLNSGTKYTYTVRARKGSVRSHHTSGISVTCLTTPQISRVTQNSDGSVSIEWKKTGGASGYYFYRRKNAKEDWKRIAQVKGTQYHDKSVGNTKYMYTVRAYKGSERSSYVTGRSLSNMPQKVKLTAAYGKDGRAVLSWQAVSGTQTYYVYRKTGSQGWKRITQQNGKNNTVYYDSAVQPGTTYLYTVRALGKTDGTEYFGTYDTKGISASVELAQPVLKSLQRESGGQKWTLTWTKVKGAEEYYVYEKISGGWKRIAETADTYYKLGAEQAPGKIFTVKAHARAGGKDIYSAYEKSGIKIPDSTYADLRILFEGDSITYGTSYLDGSDGEVTYPSRIRENLGCSISNQAVNGATLGPTSRSGNNNIYHRLEIGRVDYRGFDVICIGVGTNDFSFGAKLGAYGDPVSAGTFYGYLSGVISLIREQNPTAKIVFVTPIYRGRVTESNFTSVGYDMKNSAGVKLRDYCSAMKKTAEMNENIYVYDSEYYSVINEQNYKYALSDGLHPTQLYYGMLGNSISDYLKKII